MTGSPPTMEHRAGQRVAPELAALALHRTDPDAVSVVLYGSHARGSARPDSDIDVLEVVATRPRSYSTGNLNISAYHPLALRTMAERGDPVFDTRQAGQRLGQPPAVEALRRRLADVQPDDLAVLLAGISSVVGRPPENAWGSVEALAVAYAHTFPYASALLAQLIAGEYIFGSPGDLRAGVAVVEMA